MAEIDVSLIIPAHNEEGNLEALVLALEKELKRTRHTYEMLIVDDGSTDDTRRISETLARNFKSVNVIHRGPPNGFGLAIKDGLKAAKGRILIPVMGDLSDDPKDVPKLIKKISDGYDVVYGSRFIEGSRLEGYPLLKLMFNRIFNNLVRILYKVKEKDTTNALKAYTRNVVEKIGIENIDSNSFDITLELPLKAHMLGFKSVEVPVAWRGRTHGISKMDLLRIGPIYVKRLFSLLRQRVKDIS